MPKLKQFSGKEIVRIFEEYGFEVRRTVGSHVRLTLMQNDSSYHVTIPLHKQIKKGTLCCIIKDFELCFGKNETENCFFN
ncbi:MAG: YcfA family protein [Candidatus Falkowbacteria bacterium GW2011_GWA2_41_14]|uniref:YcfA family protein n=1 Tax=Candidatus Falkowbacteria bacterium GW2011_GWA2_41_14 TaxID=1618635 RepID=A0A0G0XU43_9BACT|nr:MAG: YcfA family protein [Candidatus Falkowbacteria bacterium GW2011_GWA2_41_14]